MARTFRVILIWLAASIPRSRGQFPVDLNDLDTVPIHFYPFGTDFGDTVAPVNDDGSTNQIDIVVAFPFYNHIHNSLFVSIIFVFK